MEPFWHPNPTELDSSSLSSTKEENTPASVPETPNPPEQIDETDQQSESHLSTVDLTKPQVGFILNLNLCEEMHTTNESVILKKKKTEVASPSIQTPKKNQQDRLFGVIQIRA